jgi:hypothetical protein
VETTVGSSKMSRRVGASGDPSFPEAEFAGTSSPSRFAMMIDHSLRR